MGSNFFKAAAPKIGPSNLNMEARAIAAPGYKGRSDAANAQKGLTMDLGLNKSKFKPQKTNGAYPPGPKI